MTFGIDVAGAGTAGGAPGAAYACLWLEEVAGMGEIGAQPRTASSESGVHNMEGLALVTDFAVRRGVAAQREPVLERAGDVR